ncbi:unnamed protein product [Ixodes pacificus]
MNSSKGTDCEEAERAPDNVGMNIWSPVFHRGGTSPKYVKQCALNLLQLCFRKDPDEKQQFLDIGCGNGEFTLQELLPRCLPCRRIVAVDVARSTLDKARESFSHPKIQYDFLDIGKDVSGFLGQYGQFDRVYSFGALQWTDQEVTFKNIEKLLTPGGECLLVYFVWSPSPDWWGKIVQKEPWTKYAKTVEPFVPKTSATPDREAVLCRILKMLEAAKLKTHTLELHKETPVIATTIDDLINAVLGPKHLAHLLSEEDNKKFEEEMADLIRRETDAEWTSGQIKRLLDMVVIHSTKSHA